MAAPLTEADMQASLAAHTDNDGLVGGLFDEIEQDWVRSGSFWIALDPRIPWRLAQVFRDRQLLPGLRLRVDVKRVVPAKGHMLPLRKAYVWGAHLRWQDLESYGRPLKTVHADETDVLEATGAIPKVIFNWDRPRDQPISVLQIEAFRDTRQTPSGSNTTRYLHSILDRDSQLITHLDGAIKTYTKDGYAAAYSGTAAKAPQYEKLFRTDDHFNVVDGSWLACVAGFFDNDELIREYFGGSND